MEPGIVTQNYIGMCVCALLNTKVMMITKNSMIMIDDYTSSTLNIRF